MTDLTVTMRLGVARSIARRKVPYFRAALLGMIPIEMPGLGTMAVSEHFVLYYDPIVFSRWNDDQVAFALVHELYHPLMEHFRRGKGHPKLKANIAADLADNPHVQALGFVPVPGALFPEMYKFPSGLSMEAYLRLLPDDVPDPDDDPRTGGGSSKDDTAGEKQKRPGTCRGKCGSGAGNPVEGEPTEDSSNEFGGRTQAEVASIRRQVAEAVQAAKDRGKLPSDLLRWSGDTLAPPKIPWQQKLAGIARASARSRPGATMHTYRKIARRQAGIGFGPGRPVIPAFHAPRPRVSVIVDTSGSMGKDELKAALSESAGILRAIHARVTFIVGDARTQGIKRVREWRDAAKLLKGGGGTDLRPMFADALTEKPRPEIIVCVTDGIVGDGIPREQPPGVRVIFVLVGKYRRNPCSWGEYVEVT